jgi:hypothetical protein
VLLSDVVERTVEQKDEGVLPRMDQSTNVEDGFAKHVVVVAQLFAIQPDGGEGVETVEDEAHPLIGGRRVIRAIEGDTVPPLFLLDPGTLLLVAVVERVRYASGRDQGGVHVSWYRDVQPAVIVEVFLEGARGSSVFRRIILQLPQLEHG